MNAHASLKPLGMPKGMNPREWRQSVEKRLNDLLDRAMSLITALDLMQADCDLESTDDDEPSLGWTERGPAAGGANDDREADDCDLEDGGDTELNGDETDHSRNEDEMCTGDERDPAAAPMAEQAIQRLREIQMVLS